MQGDAGQARPGVVVHVANAFRPDRGRRVLPVDRGQTVRGWLDGQGIAEFPVPTICLFNGRALMRAEWPETAIRRGDVVAFVALPHGGGGGGGGKNPLRTVLSIAVMVGGMYLGAAYGAQLAGAFGFDAGVGAFGSVTYGQIAGGVISGGVSLLGGALVNSLVPAPKASASIYNGGAAAAPAASPTYSLQGQGNTARLGQSIPCQYGRHKIYPDLITAEPWAEYADNEQYLYQAHCLGLGEYAVERINIADTEISNFAEITYEIVEPGETITLFDINVISRPEISGQELKGSNEWEGDGWVGPFVLNPVDSVANEVGVDVVCPRGLYYANDAGGLDSRTVSWVVECRAIDDDDLALGDGSWTVLGSESLLASSTTALRRSFRYDLPAPGRYEVRARRTDSKDTSSRAGHEIVWAGLKAFVDGPDSFDGLTLLLVKMRATNNLSSRSSRLVNVIQTRKLPVWDAVDGWSDPQPTRSIAWALADVARAEYGAELADARLPLADLVALDAVWQGRGDTFDGVFDSKTTVWDALGRVARCGRAVPVLQGGIIRVFRDGPQTLPVAMFGPRNIVKGSLKIDYVMPSDDTADAVTVEYFSERSWRPAEVTASLPDSTAEKPATVSLLGAVKTAHAEREGEYMAADNRYRRKFVTYRTELEGLIPTYGDLISVTHDMPRWGQGCEVVEWDSDGEILTLSEPLEWLDGAGHFIALRDRDGSLVGPFACEPAARENQVHLLEALTIEPYTGASAERTHATFGPVDKWGQLCRVRYVRPRSGGEQVEILAVAEDARVHVN